MIALDTNILLRFLLRDDEIQSDIARRILAEELTATRPGFISMIVVVELYWVLSRAYRKPDADIRRVLADLLDTPVLAFEAADLVRAALAMPETDLADMLIHLRGLQAGCSHTLSFDQHFAKTAGVNLATAAP
jgi:predicted nucleic-acid-binding protein